MVLVAAVQSRPVYLDSMATARKAVDLIGECSSLGVELAVFPESFIPGSPHLWVYRAKLASEPYLAFEEAFLRAAVSVPGPETELIAQACSDHGVTVAMGVTERPERSGTLYNTLLYFGSDGSILGRHRKLMPTYGEHVVWGRGDGSTLRTVDTPFGVVGGLICWENYMPLSRMVLYSQGEQIHVAPTLNPGTDLWLSAMKSIANEGRMWVVSVGNYMAADDIPADLMALGLVEQGETINPGGSAIIDPRANIVAGPVYGEEAILTAEVDTESALKDKRMFDVVGHYGRPDVFDLRVLGQEVPLQLEQGVTAQGLSDRIWTVAESSSRTPT